MSFHKHSEQAHNWSCLSPRIANCPYLTVLVGQRLQILLKEPDIDKEEVLRKVESLLNYFVTCDEHDLSSEEIDCAGLSIMKAFSVICKSKPADMLQLIMEAIYFGNKNKVILETPKGPMEISVRKSFNFVRAIMSGFRHLNWDKDDIESLGGNYDQFVMKILIYILNLVEVEKSTSIAIAKSFIYVVERHAKFTSPSYRRVIFSLTMKKVTTSYSSVKSYIAKIYQVVMHLVNIQIRLEYFDDLMRSSKYCDSSSFVKIEAVIKNIPIDEVKRRLEDLVRWILAGFTRQYTACHARKILKFLLTRLEFDEFLESVHRHLYYCEKKLTNLSERTSFNENKFIHIYQLVVAQYKDEFYNFYQMRANPTEFTIFIFMGVQQGCVKAEMFKSELENSLLHPLERQINAFKVICCFPRKTSALTEWHVGIFSVFMLTVTHNYLEFIRKDIVYFFSHLFISFRTVEDSELLELYKYFMDTMTTFVNILLYDNSQFEKAVMVYDCMASVFIQKKFKFRYSLSSTELELMKNDETDYFDRDMLAKLDIAELQKHLTDENVQTDIVIQFFYNYYFDTLSSRKHYEFFLWALSSLKNNENYNNVEKFVKVILVHLKYLKKLKDSKYDVYLRAIHYYFEREFEGDQLFPCYTFLKLMTACYEEGFYDKDNSSLFKMSNKLLIGLDLILKCPLTGSVSKEVEHKVVASFQLLGLVTLYLKDRDLIDDCIKLSNKIISSTNMRKAITDASVQLRKICINILYPDEDPKIKPILNRSLSFLVNTISDIRTTDNSLTTSFNCLEALIEDHSVTSTTHRYLETIIIQGIHLFAKSNWRLKNAILQGLSASLNRLLGQKNAGSRPTRIEDIYCIFPKLTSFLFKIVTGHSSSRSHESVIATLALFSESYCDNEKFLNVYMKRIDNIFVDVFVNMVLYNPLTGPYAALAISALCTKDKIPLYICEITQYIQGSFPSIPMNSFRNVMYLLRSLCIKLNTFDVNINLSKSDRMLVNSKLHELFHFLKGRNSGRFHLLFCMLQLNGTDCNEADKPADICRKEIRFPERLCLYSKIRSIIATVPVSILNKTLNDILSCSGVFQIRCLSYVAERLNDIPREQTDILWPIFFTLFTNFVQNQYSCQYLISVYSNLIIFLLKRLKCSQITPPIIDVTRSYYGFCRVENLYVCSVFAAIISRFPVMLDVDSKFVNRLVETYKKAFAFENYDRDIYLASTLIYVFRCAGQVERCVILKIAFRFLFEDETCEEIFKFLSLAFKTPYCGLLSSICNILDVENLKKCVDNYHVAKFLAELLVFLQTLNKEEMQDKSSFFNKYVSEIYFYKNFSQKTALHNFLKIYDILTEEECSKLFSECSFNF